MKLMHIADLHFGKIVHGVNMIEDQKAWAKAFVELVRGEAPHAVLIAGDVYDRSQPSEEAVLLLNEFITDLAGTGVPVMIVAGNHDSAGKLAYGRELFRNNRIHISGMTEKKLDRITLEDEYGPVDFYLMPYIFPAAVRDALGLSVEELPNNYRAAAEALLAAQGIDEKRRNVLITHLNVTADGNELPHENSETAIGGVGGIDYRAFDAFDYVALGHIHANRSVGREAVRYAGTPLCYHFNETRQGPKGALLVTLDGEGNVTLEQRAIEPLHRMVEFKGNYEEILAGLAALEPGCYAGVVLTDRRNDPDVSRELRAVAEGRNAVLMKIESVYEPNAFADRKTEAENRLERSPAELFADFYRSKLGSEPDDKDLGLMRFLGLQCEGAYGDGRDPSERAVNAVIDFILGQEG